MHSTKKEKSLYQNRKFFIFIAYSFFTGICVIIAYGYWLDRNIQSRINGNVWKLPATVYSRIVTLKPYMSYTQRDIITLLKSMRYRQVTHMLHSGEFTVYAHSIEMIRRPFDFPDKPEEATHVRLNFSQNYLMNIKNLAYNYNLDSFRLDPCLITLLHSPDGEQRLFIKRSHFPQPLINILINTEDRHFYHHAGINLYSICRAFLVNLSAGHTVQGGSTLTQQLVKNLFLTNQRSIWRKVTEAYMAIILDARYDKDRILELYLNEVYLGQMGSNQIHGFPLASLYYFGRQIDEISLDQQALLVGMVKGASFYNPWRNPEVVLERRNLLLRLLQQQGIIDRKCCLILSARPLGVCKKSGLIAPRQAFIQLVYTELQANLSDKHPDLSGVKIFTTLDPLSQDAAERSIIEEMNILRNKQKIKDLEGAIVVVDRFTGEIHAMVCGRDPQFPGHNRILKVRRSIGSLAKPAIYLTAFNKPETYHLNTWIANDPLNLSYKKDPTWKPQNNTRLLRRKVMLIDAFVNSMHSPAIQLGMTLGLMPVLDTWEKLGVPKKQLQPIPSILQGTLNLTPMEVAQTFQTIASGGNRAPLSALRTVLSANGTILYQSLPYAARVITPQSAYLTLYATQKVVERGAARELGILYPDAHLAGKTGTTSNLVDNWFAGIDGKEVTITWIGRDNQKSTTLCGVHGAMQIYRRYLENNTPWPLILTLPENISLIPVNETGHFICGRDTIKSYVPIWTTNQNSLCQNKKSNKEENTYSMITRLKDICHYLMKNFT
ncbi:Penicillin-binding protein 1B, isoform gamma [Candidatus Erwinia haradaeae]|uniref:Penicillin-binding protein 1B n=1 Tax=Candidatus Erwinia haradaeae TaxID=1922217 RepID=A0A451DD02_9GAMM|nr:bifunctional glycosyl transferase/transpeptidase [Candidatus Erwinia haradaeae]VFP84342.1 Penicillin-binding protein 1B, isoform gamma [Candidatus Erwinia haradaeae]